MYVQKLMFKDCKMYKMKIKASFKVAVWRFLKMLLLNVKGFQTKNVSLKIYGIVRYFWWSVYGMCMVFV